MLSGLLCGILNLSVLFPGHLCRTPRVRAHEARNMARTVARSQVTRVKGYSPRRAPGRPLRFVSFVTMGARGLDPAKGELSNGFSGFSTDLPTRFVSDLLKNTCFVGARMEKNQLNSNWTTYLLLLLSQTVGHFLSPTLTQHTHT